ncbi:gfo/Idh/MocA family oxidoreductase [Peribacillus saganii]|uniref:Gfo/Idh/MocA family oxidoreductase n=1 Tax=Peribacillus saganii TaxID=2303992 RepID=A0A372LSQ2_9BACI|nr:gfo/Idh/MocA family oxidoreductase [Peribacillus saganii]
MRIGIIGAGGIAQSRHIPAFLKLSDQCTITALSDVNFARAKETAETFNIPLVFEKYEEMFPEVDAVCICTPNKFHAEITIAALEAGVHVMCEKPMALSTVECETMIAAAQKAEKVLAIAYHYRFMKESAAAKRAIKEIGMPLVTRVQALRRRKVPGWGVFTNKGLQGGGSLIDYGCHLLDLALWLMGNPKTTDVVGSTYNMLSRMSGQVNLWGHFDHESFNVDDHVTAYIKFANGASMLFETSWAANIKEDHEHVSISGVDGGLSVFPLELYKTENGMLVNSQPVWIPGEEDPGLPQARNFIDACLRNAPLIVKPEEALQVSQIIEAIYENRQSGSTEGVLL